SAHNIEVGYAYKRGALLPEADAADEVWDPCNYVASARPGHRLPHVWLGHGVNRVSSLDLVDAAHLTLFVGPEATDWCDAAEQVRSEGRSLVVVGVDGDTGVANERSWAVQTGVGNRGVVLVRPDLHVAWRSGVGETG